MNFPTFIFTLLTLNKKKETDKLYDESKLSWSLVKSFYVNVSSMIKFFSIFIFYRPFSIFKEKIVFQFIFTIINLIYSFAFWNSKYN